MVDVLASIISSILSNAGLPSIGLAASAMIDPLLALAHGGGGGAPVGPSVAEGEMGREVFLLGLYLALALGVSFLCSLLEACLLSVPRPHVMVMANTGKRGGALLLQMKDNIDRPLAAILTLNTVAHTIGAAGAGAQVLVIFGSKWVALGSVVVTLLILVLSEIIPKTLGAVYAKPLAGFSAMTIRLIILSTYPLVILLEMLSKKLGGGKEAGITREEVKVFTQLGVDAGVIEAAESRVIRNLLRLREVKVKDIMTPRAVAYMIEQGTTVREAISERKALRFSRYPVYGESPDEVLGIVLKHDLLHAAHEGRGDQPVQEMLKPIYAVPELASVSDALEQFIQRGDHLGLVVDEFGGTAGLVTLEDCVETLLGVEIVDETDTVKDMRKLARTLVERRRERKLHTAAVTIEADGTERPAEPGGASGGLRSGVPGGTPGGVSRNPAIPAPSPPLIPPTGESPSASPRELPGEDEDRDAKRGDDRRSDASDKPSDNPSSGT